MFNNFKQSADPSNVLTAEDISSFNAKITPYIGKNISGSQVNALINLVRAINSRNDSIKSVTMTYGTKTQSKTKNELTRVPTVNYYEVTGVYDDNGLITTIRVSDT